MLLSPNWIIVIIERDIGLLRQNLQLLLRNIPKFAKRNHTRQQTQDRYWLSTRLQTKNPLNASQKSHYHTNALYNKWNEEKEIQ
jgi:hypothetical protein